MSSVKRLQEEHGIVNIRFIEPKLLDGLDLAGDPFARNCQSLNAVVPWNSI